MKGYIGAANIDTNSRLCMSSAVAGHKRAFGEDVVPVSYEDLELADLIVLVGSNTAWCHPVLFQRIVSAKQRRPELQIVVIDPRRTATCEQADLHLPVRPGSDVWLFNGLLAYLHEHGIVDSGFVEAHTRGADDAIDVAQRSTGSLAHVARQCGLSETLLRQFYALFARTERVITAFSMGVNQSSAGTDKVNSIINCHLLSGRIGQPGMGPFSITGQPNAMGGREVGGLANMLAAHLDLENATHRTLVQGYWNSPHIAGKPGLKAVDLFDAVHDGRVKAIWIMATNPVVSLPDADKVRDALQRCEFVVVSELMRDTDTTRHAHVLLPATGWGERDGTVTNSERRISRQRPFLPAPGEAKADWWIICEVARRMGCGEAFGFRSSHEIFVEYARLTATGQQLAPRQLNLGGLASLSRAEYDTLLPVRWPLPDRDAERAATHPQPFSDGRFSTSDGRARLLPLLPRTPQHAPDDDYPLILNTGRVRDHWHTMSRTGKSPKLATHSAEPYAEIHPQDALLCGIQQGRLVRVSTRWGACVVRAKLGAEIPRRQIFIPIHWNGQTASDARVGALVNPVADPISGEPEFKHTPARVEPFYVDWFGFMLVRNTRPAVDESLPAPQQGFLNQSRFAWWTRIQGAQFVRYEFAGRGRVEDWATSAHALLGIEHEDADWLEASDSSEGLYRAAHLHNDAIDACLFVSPRSEDLPARAWLSGLFMQDKVSELDRIALLVGQPFTPQADEGATVCSCFGVGRNRITQAVRDGCGTPEALGARLKCGTNCGSCIPELKVLIASTQAAAREEGSHLAAKNPTPPVSRSMAISADIDADVTPVAVK
jgi:assimilatory nitrate reductase catalytic subunit